MASETNKDLAMARLPSPSATSPSTSSSRSVSSTVGRRILPTSRWATTGERTVSPLAARPTASTSRSGSASFSRYPQAPASMARRMSASVS